MDRWGDSQRDRDALDRWITRDQPEDRPCGCPEDYHLADCPIRTGEVQDDEPPEQDDWRDD